MGISAGNLAELLADQFAARPPALQAPPPEAAALSIPSSCHHADWVAAQIQALCSEPIRVYELKAALDQTSRLQGDGKGGTARLEWIAAQLQYFPEQQSGFRCQRCTADSISDVVATLEDAKATGDVAMLVLLDVKSAFDGLPHAVIKACLDRLGLSGCLRRFISAFLTGRTFRVRVGQELSEPRDITTGVPQGSILMGQNSNT
ncbi:uncharacterized protein LOC119459384 [Dermacentor silvarum]|uniref:uncharacterized protein LOC119459384 n=1 Tax=Dermacentor silvarum TaxID=543639 RepID=UPI001896FA1A|nr:uncharacterized protein LOC119459384 [Dermacentor silvarum]